MLLNIEAIMPDKRIAFHQSLRTSSRTACGVSVDEDALAYFSVLNGDVSVDDLLNTKYEILSFVQSDFVMIKHPERYFSMWESPSPLSEKTHISHYKRQIGRYYSPLYQSGDMIDCYDRKSVTIERKEASGELLIFTLVAPDAVVSYVKAALASGNLSKQKIGEIEDSLTIFL